MTRFIQIAARVMIVLMVACSVTFAAPLDNEIPGDAIVYAGWSGTETAGDAYAQSHLKGMIDSWDLLGNLEAMIVPQLEADKDEAGLATAKHLFALAPMMMHKGWAIYIGGVDRGETAKDDQLRFAMICHAGAEAAALHEHVKGLLETDPKMLEKNLTLIQRGEVVALVNKRLDAAHLARLGLGDGSTPASPALTDNDRFKEAMSVVGGDKAMTVSYLDVTTGLKLVMDLTEQERTKAKRTNNEDFEKARKFFAMSGLDAVGRIASSGLFEGQDWRDRQWIEAPAPRKGFLTLLDGPALDKEVLKVAPRTATWMIAGKFDVAGIMPMIRQMVHELSPEDEANFNQSVAQTKEFLGVDLEKDVLATLGSQWLMYGDFSAAGPMGMNLMLVNFLRDANKLDGSLKIMEDKLNKALANENGPVNVKLQRSPAGDAMVTYLNFPMFSPAWAIHKQRFYFSLSPAAVSSRIGFDSVEMSPITDNADFIALTKRLDRTEFNSVAFSDLPKVAPMTLSQIAAYLQMMQQFLPANGGFDPMRLMPDTAKLMAHLTPSMRTSWTDATGYHEDGLVPFPGADMLSPSGLMSVASTSFAAGIIMPSLGRARVVANRTVSANNIKQIEIALIQWSTMHDGKYPPDMGRLVKDGLLEPKAFVKHEHRGEVPDQFDSAEAKAKWVNEHSDYVYRPVKAGAEPKADEILVYEKITDETDEGVNVGYGDGHVEFVDLDTAKDQLKKAGEKVPDVVPGAGGGAIGGPQGKAKAVDPGKAYFYDVKTKEYFVDSATKIPPIKSAAGNDAVRAHFFTCNDCGDNNRFIGYYEKYEPQVKAKLDARLAKQDADAEFYEEAFQGRLYSTDGIKWVAAESPEGFKIVEDLMKKCPEKQLHYCPPD
ncbi:MAG: hypothetical protein GC162_07195 [Planctomycetes bacterium]|nr:hypothetical protein [Planctomycetota bacterium]